jgi:hypothetical protein
MVTIEQLKEYSKDAEWLHSNYAELLKFHNNEYVAIRDQNILRFDKDFDKLRQAIKQDGIEPSQVLIEYVSEIS